MNETVICFIPKDHNFVPDHTAINAIENLLSNLYQGCSEISINRAYEMPFFIDCGQNHESIFCPNCNSEVNSQSWQQMMEACWVEQSQGYNLKSFNTECCNKVIGISDFIYKPYQSFASFSVEVVNPKNHDHNSALAEINKLLPEQFCIVSAKY